MYACVCVHNGIAMSTRTLAVASSTGISPVHRRGDRDASASARRLPCLARRPSRITLRRAESAARHPRPPLLRSSSSGMVWEAAPSLHSSHILARTMHSSGHMYRTRPRQASAQAPQRAPQAQNQDPTDTQPAFGAAAFGAAALGAAAFGAGTAVCRDRTFTFTLPLHLRWPMPTSVGRDVRSSVSIVLLHGFHQPERNSLILSTLLQLTCVIWRKW